MKKDKAQVHLNSNRHIPPVENDGHALLCLVSSLVIVVSQVSEEDKIFNLMSFYKKSISGSVISWKMDQHYSIKVVFHCAR